MRSWTHALLLLFLLAACPGETPPDAVAPDAEPDVSSVADVAAPDADSFGPVIEEAGVPDAAPPDVGAMDAEVPDVEVPDAGVPDAGAPAELTPDVAAPDVVPDVHEPDPPAPAIVIVMIGDGMGQVHMELASNYSTGAPGGLTIHGMTHQGELATASFSGVTDSAAAATSIATGTPTLNGRIALDRDGASLETLVEAAQALGIPAGLVTTAALQHATPGAFSAHRLSRQQYVDIADDQALVVRPTVMLGGGAKFALPAGPDSVRDDEGLIAPLMAAGYTVLLEGDELPASTTAIVAPHKLAGYFASDHMDYVVDAEPGDGQPSLVEMTEAAIAALDGGDGFFLMVEGARIDMASHGNDLERMVGEMLAFDEAVATVLAWAGDRPEATVLVTADHETGALEVVGPAGLGQLPEVAWGSKVHSNDRVVIAGHGPGSELFDGAVLDHRWVHAVALSRLTAQPLVPPGPVLIPDGRLTDHAYQVVEQTVTTGFGATHNRLDALTLDADPHGLFVGVEGLFEWDNNAVVVLVDLDFGASTGLPGLDGATSDDSGTVDAIVSHLKLTSPGIPGFGADFVVVVPGGTNPHVEDLWDDAGLRGLVPPYGETDNLWWFGAAINFGEGVRTSGDGGAPVPGEGLELFLPWANLYGASSAGGPSEPTDGSEYEEGDDLELPDTPVEVPPVDSAVPPGATVAIAVILVNSEGTYLSNQALPPFAPGTENPAYDALPVPGVVTFQVDANGDGVADGDAPPEVVWP